MGKGLHGNGVGTGGEIRGIDPLPLRYTFFFKIKACFLKIFIRPSL